MRLSLDADDYVVFLVLVYLTFCVEGLVEGNNGSLEILRNNNTLFIGIQSLPPVEEDVG